MYNWLSLVYNSLPDVDKELDAAWCWLGAFQRREREMDEGPLSVGLRRGYGNIGFRAGSVPFALFPVEKRLVGFVCYVLLSGCSGSCAGGSSVIATLGSA